MLTAKDFGDQMTKLSGFYGKSLNEVQRDLWFKQVKHVDYFDLCSGVNAAISDERLLPTPKVLLEHIDRARAQRASQARQREDTSAKNFLNPAKQNSQIGRDCVALIVKMIDGGMSSTEYGLAVGALDQKYPGVGFRKAGESIMREALDREDHEHKQERA